MDWGGCTGGHFKNSVFCLEQGTGNKKRLACVVPPHLVVTVLGCPVGHLILRCETGGGYQYMVCFGGVSLKTECFLSLLIGGDSLLFPSLVPPPSVL